jgi:hypothetical protein
MSQTGRVADIHSTYMIHAASTNQNPHGCMRYPPTSAANAGATRSIGAGRIIGRLMIWCEGLLALRVEYL